MKLKKYIKGLQKFVEANPGSENYKVVTSADDEGNSYNEVCWDPSAGHYEDSEFYQEEDYKPNAVCVN